MKRLISILILVLFIYPATGQIIFTFVPEVYARNIDGLSNFQVQNLTGQKVEGRVSITVRDNINKLPVVTILTPLTAFNTGNNLFPKSSYINSAFRFAANKVASIVNQTRTFPPGEYTICYNFGSSKDLADEYENCFETSIQPLLPIALLSPAEGDTICIKRPVLSWQPPMPFTQTMRFRLLLTEKKAGATATESMIKSAPLLMLDNISSTTINYPSNYPELKEGKTYCWQVAAYEQGLIISTSEVWEFTVQCKEPVKPAPNDSYRELKLMINGNYYIVNSYFKFSFLNNYNSQSLSYSIIDLENAGNQMKNKPEIKLKHGVNMIDLDLTDMGLKNGGHYALRVFPFNESPVEVRFIYQENE